MKAPQQTSPRTKRSSELISAPRKATTIEIDEEVLLRNGMEAALQQHIIPWLLEYGFTGEMPHFQRRRAHHLELLTFQFDRYGGGFVIELGKAPLGDFTVFNGEVIPESLLTPSYVDDRVRIGPGENDGSDPWFRYDLGQFEICVSQIFQYLSLDPDWWDGDGYEERK